MRPAPAPLREVTVHSEHPIAIRRVVVPHEDVSEDAICIETRTLDGRRLARIRCPKEGFSMGQTRDLLRAVGPLPIMLHATQRSNGDVEGHLYAPLPTQPPAILNLGMVLRLSFERKHRGRLKWEAEDLLREVLAGHGEEPSERIMRHLSAAPTKELTGEELED